MVLVVAEDACGFPGKRIVQFGFSENETHDFLPGSHVRNTVVDTGTHDKARSLAGFGSSPHGEGPPMTDCVLRLRGITKRFGNLLANDSISLDLRHGEVLALLGENGAGKSTLVAILFGHYVADAGTIAAFGKPLPAGEPRAALDAGIGMVHQHSTLADNLSVLDNVMLGTEPLWRPWSRRDAARRRLLGTAQRFGLSVPPDAPVGQL